ncbi:MAG: TIGR04283 family arsenosugar biosynthesis glycosyltransferase [Anaerolineales bacterium]|nr:TIGR04283 family arsenosugar biosynthesis glycosyltransferase [Anaerolineales bacterium]
MISLTVIIPTLNEAEFIDGILTRALHGSSNGRPELLVVDGGSSDSTVAQASSRARVLRGRPGRAHQLELGVRQASGEYVLFCHADTLLPLGYDHAVAASMQEPEVVGGAFTVQYKPGHPWLRIGEWLVGLPTPLLMFGDQALFARRSELLAVGGVPQLPLMEDVALIDSLRERGRVVRRPERAVTSSRRFFEHGVLRQLSLDLILLLAYRAGVTPERLARLYFTSRRDRQATV